MKRATALKIRKAIVDWIERDNIKELSKASTIVPIEYCGKCNRDLPVKYFSAGLKKEEPIRDGYIQGDC